MRPVLGGAPPQRRLSQDALILQETEIRGACCPRRHAVPVAADSEVGRGSALTCAMAPAVSPRSSATSAMPRSACWWMDVGAPPLISPKAASPSDTQPAHRGHIGLSRLNRTWATPFNACMSAWGGSSTPTPIAVNARTRQDFEVRLRLLQSAHPAQCFGHHQAQREGDLQAERQGGMREGARQGRRGREERKW